MKDLMFKFYSVLKNEDAVPFVGGNILAVADGLGGSGSSVHAIDKTKHSDLHAEIMASAFGDMQEISPKLNEYVEELIAPMIDGEDDTSALWASRIVIARCVYALLEGDFINADLSDLSTRIRLSAFISKGLHEVATHFDFQSGKYDGQLLLPTTLAVIRFTERDNTVIAETLWAGDSRCYALTIEGLKILSVDDEDDSGSITNLFYADNDKVALHYLRHEIKKPCALLSVSDGVFDSFIPYDHLGMEHTLLSAIKECGSAEQLSGTLKQFYDGVRGDDSTMAFSAIGFDGYEDMKNAFAKRTDEILTIRQKQADFYGALEVMNQTEDEASHYILSRTGDRFDYIVPMIVDAIDSGASDIAITPEVKTIVEGVKRDFIASIKKIKRQNYEQSLKNLYTYVKAHPELLTSEILTKRPIDFKNNVKLKCNYLDMNKYSAEYLAIMHDETALRLEAQLVARSEELHRKVMEKVHYYRDCFDNLWNDKTSDCKLRSSIGSVLRIWQDIDFDLQYNWRVSNIGLLPQADRALAYEVSDYIDKYRSTKAQIKSRHSGAEIAYKRFVECWNEVFCYLKNNPNAIYVLLSSETVHKFGFDASEESLEIEFGKDKRERILRELREGKTAIVCGIVKALALNCDRVSVIDSQYNATKLALFRTYFRLKTMDSDELKVFESQLDALDSAYTSLVKK